MTAELILTYVNANAKSQSSEWVGYAQRTLPPQGLGIRIHQAPSMLTYSIFDMWCCRLTIRNGRGQLSEALCFSTILVSIHKNVAILSGFMFMHDWAWAQIFFAWWKKLVVQVSVNRLSAVLCGRTSGSRWTQKECRAKRNVLPVHLIHIKPIIFGHPLSLYLFFIAVTSGSWRPSGSAIYCEIQELILQCYDSVS